MVEDTDTYTGQPKEGLAEDPSTISIVARIQVNSELYFKG
jgi:hypothetical protein